MLTILSKASKLIRDKQFPQALKELDSIDRSRLHGEEWGEYCLLRSEAALRTGNLSFVPVDEAVEFYRHSADTSKFGKAKLLKGWLLSSQGAYFEAIEPLLEAHASYLRCNDHGMRAGVLALLADLYSHVGDMDAAVLHGGRCVEVLSELDGQEHLISAIQNYGCYCVLAGRMDEAISAYDKIRHSICKLSESSRLIYYEMSAIPHALRGDIAKARKIIAKCKPYLDKFGRERGVYFENLGWINLLAGDYEAAEKAFSSGLKVASELESAPALVCQIKRLLGDLYVATGDYDKAEGYAGEALTASETTNKRPEIAACQRIFARIENQRGNTDKAREWFRKAIELFGVIGANYELAVTRYLAGVSGLYRNGERQAFLWMAREYFAEEEVKPYLQKVDAALTGGGRPHPVSKDNAPTIIAESKAIRDLVLRADNIASADMTILLTGPTGTGKDLFARYIHAVSGRKGEFVPVNAAAIPNDLVESELFGHRKGAFTGATESRSGLIEQANNGTLYLNEIADASPQLQAKLLEVIETREVRRLGGNGSRPVSVRIIAATNHDLQQRIADGHFRVDLYHRLNEIPIELPPLSERPEDIEPLVRHFLELAGANGTGGKAEAKLAEVLSRMVWPGNVRQLQATISRLWLLSGGDRGRMVYLAESTAEDSQREELLEALRQTDWNRREAARLLGVSEGTIRYRIRKLGLEEPHRS